MQYVTGLDYGSDSCRAVFIDANDNTLYINDDYSTTSKLIGGGNNKYDYIQLKNVNGYDHNLVLNTVGDVTKLAAKGSSSVSGITLEVCTNEPRKAYKSVHINKSGVKTK
jgi:ribulose kinase